MSYRDGQPDLVIASGTHPDYESDEFRLSQMDGLTAARTIRALGTERAAAIPIIAMTANAFKEDIDNCLACGMNDHLAKPIDEKAVIKMMSQFTGRS